MDTDLYLVVGILALALAVPSILSAWVDGHVPRAAAILVMIGGVLIILALNNHARGYSFSEIPDVFMRVFNRFVH